MSSPEVVLAAIAARTERIRLGSAVTVLSSDDPIRVFQRFATLDARVERPRRGHPRARVVHRVVSAVRLQARQYEQLFEEKLDLFAALIGEQPVTWQGTPRPPLRQQRVFPPIETGALKTWIGVGGSPESVVRAARYGLPLMLAIIGGDPKRFRPYVDLYHRAWRSASRCCRLAFIRRDMSRKPTEQAREELWPDYKLMRDRIGAERGWPPMRRAEFDREADSGSLYVGSPETVARKIASTVEALGIARFDLKYSAGALSHEKLMRNIDLYGREVIPRVRKLLGENAVDGPRAAEKAV